MIGVGFEVALPCSTCVAIVALSVFEIANISRICIWVDDMFLRAAPQVSHGRYMAASKKAFRWWGKEVLAQTNKHTNIGVVVVDFEIALLCSTCFVNFAFGMLLR